jgi:Flp pilus assembly protein TadG
MTRPIRPAARRGERGAATAELVMSLPLLMAVTVGLVWLLSVGSAQVRAVDAAREAARAAARGDDTAAAAGRAEQVAPPGSRVTVTTEGDSVRAVVVGRVSGPGGMFRHLPGVTVSAQAVAAAEEASP